MPRRAFLLVRPTGLSFAIAPDVSAAQAAPTPIALHPQPDRPAFRRRKGARMLVHLGGESSKLLFDTLAQWNHALSQTSIAGILPAANSNDVARDDDSSSVGGTVPLDPNVVGIDLSARRPQRPTYRGPKKRRSDDDGMEVGHG